MTKAGILRGCWERIGHTNNVGSLEHILFRDTNDYGHRKGETPVKISHNWSVWRINKEQEYVGKLTGENRKAEIGIVFVPDRVVQRMKTGEYGGIYPDFE